MGGTNLATSERVRDFIVSELRWEGPPSALTEDYPLIQTGVIDSLGLFRLVEFLESEYGIRIDDTEIVPENFATLSSIMKLTERAA
jgi:acyl carrier protein